MVAFPPAPAARLALLINVWALATCVCLHAALLLAYGLVQRRRRERALLRQSNSSLPTVGEGDEPEASPAKWRAFSGGSSSSELSAAGTPVRQQQKDEEAELRGPALSPLQCLTAASVAAELDLAQQRRPTADEEAPCKQQPRPQHQPSQQEADGQALPRPGRQVSTLRPELPLQRGLLAKYEALQRRRPRLVSIITWSTMSVVMSAGRHGHTSHGPRLCRPFHR